MCFDVVVVVRFAMFLFLRLFWFVVDLSGAIQGYRSLLTFMSNAATYCFEESRGGSLISKYHLRRIVRVFYYVAVRLKIGAWFPCSHRAGDRFYSFGHFYRSDVDQNVGVWFLCHQLHNGVVNDYLKIWHEELRNFGRNVSLTD